MVTMKDIANHCGLSIATVSKALNNMPDISPATIRRVQAAAQEMGYLPNAAARTMKTGQSMTVGLLLFLGDEDVWTHNYFSRIASGIHAVMENNGYDLTPVSCLGAGRMGSFLNYCRHRNYDGLIVMSGGYSEPTLMELVDSGIPLVTIDYEFPHRSSVSSDNRQSMNELVRYVCEMGHRRIALIHGDDTIVTQTRIRSFLDVCREYGVETPPEYIRPAMYHNTQLSERITGELIRLENRPTCILYPDDYACMGGLRMLKQLGLSVPEDVSVAGYDGTFLAEVHTPPLTTLAQDADNLGKQAAEMLLQVLAGPRTFSPQHIVLPGKLIEGGTVRNLNAR